MNWVYCPNCNSKLLKEDLPEGRVEVPCSSCNEIIILKVNQVKKIDAKVSKSPSR